MKAAACRKRFEEIGRAKYKVVIAGGGTAGHVYPALAVADALSTLGVSRESILFIGSKHGQEAQLVRESGYEIYCLAAKGIVRKVNFKAAWAVVLISASIVRSITLILKHKPRITISVGGYASIPGAIASLLCRVPVVVVNVDAAPGAANRLLARFAKFSFTSFGGEGLPRQIVVGTPIRNEILNSATIRKAMDDKTISQARETLSLEKDKPIVVIFGGSLGAKTLNDAAPNVAKALLERGINATVVHLAGKRGFSELSGANVELSNYVVREFEKRMNLLLEVAALVVSRSGALTVSEIAVMGVPSILVPLPNAPRDHQRRNAEKLQMVGGAIIMNNSEVQEGKLSELVISLLNDPKRLIKMSESLDSLMPRNGAEKIASSVLSVIGVELVGAEK